MRDKERETRKKLETVVAGWKVKRHEEEVVVDEEAIASIISKWTGVPISSLEEGETEKLLRMEEDLHKKIVGQDEAVTAISRALRRSRADLKDPKRPIGSFVFLGPTGVGKTLVARALAEFMFGNEDAMIQLDMSEYMEKFAASRLTGSPPGYVGYEEGGQLTEQVRRKPYCVVLLDEIDKAHPDVLNVMLQVMEEGKLTDSLGRKVDFRNAILIMTTNIGAEVLKKQSSLGFGPADEAKSFEAMKDKIMNEARKAFKPEFLNRIDEVIVFKPLSFEDLLKIIDLEINKVEKRLDKQGIKLSVDKKSRDYLVEKGYDPKYGARPLRRAIQRYIEDPLSEYLLKNSKKKDKDKVAVKAVYEKEGIVFK